MLIDLNTVPEEGGDEVSDLNNSPAQREEEQDVVAADKVGEADHFDLHPVQNDEQTQIYQGDNGGPPFDLNDPLEEEQNLHAGDNAGHAFDLNDPLEEQDNLHAGDDNIALQEQDTLDDVIHDFGVYTYAVDILFNEEELSDSDDEDYQQPLQEEAPSMLKNLTQRQRQDIYQDLLQSRFASVKH